MKKISLLLATVIAVLCMSFQVTAEIINGENFEVHNASVQSTGNNEMLVKTEKSGGYAAKTAILQKGAVYSINADVKLESGADIMQFVVETDKTYPDDVGVGTYVTSEYTTLSGTYIYDGEALNTEAKVYIVIGNGTKNTSYYIKDFEIKTGREVFFTDVEKTDPCYEYIFRLSQDGVVTGKSDTIYDPDTAVTRAEFVALLIRALDIATVPYKGEFTDVPEGVWYSDAAAVALTNGLEEYSGTFNPEGNITASQAVNMAAKVIPGLNITAGEETLNRKNAAKIIFTAREAINRTSYYVNPETGDDSSEGTLEAPFKTFQKAKEVMREVSPSMKNNLYVYLAGGQYYIDETVKFASTEGGKNGYRIFYKNLPGEIPVMQAGEKVEGWQLHDAEKNIYKAPANGSESRLLVVNGTRAVRARSKGGLTNAEVYNSGIRCDDVELADFAVPSDLELAFVNKWMLKIANVTKINVNPAGKCEIVINQEFWSANQNGSVNQKLTESPAWYENAYELLDEPGEFYLSKKDDVFYYIPRENENIDSSEFFAGREMDIFTINEEKNISSPFTNVTFDGIKFSGTAWNKPSESGFDDVQNAIGIPFTRAIFARRIENVDIINCRFENLGGEGIELITGVKNTNIIGNRFYDISGHAMWIGEYEWENVEKARWDENIKISNNYIEKAGCEYMSAVPLVTGFLKDTEITHNEIFDCHYSGMHIGFGWDAVKTSNTINMLIAYNYIHEVMQTLEDGGAIYCLGGTGGTVENPNRIYRNYIVNQYARTSVLYTDEGSSYWRIHENVQDMTDSMSRWTPDYGSSWTTTVHDILYEDNYVMIDRYQNGGTDCVYRNAHVYPTANWDEKPLEIMQEAGLEPEYAHIGRPDNSVKNIVMVNDFDIKTGERISLELKALTKAGDEVDISGAEIEYYTRNPEIIEVHQDGTVVGKQPGKGIAGANVKIGDKVFKRETDIYVDDVLEEIVQVSKFRPDIIVGEEKTGLEVSAKSRFGKTLALDDIKFSSSNPESLEVAPDGSRINALKEGEAAVVAEGRVKNVVVKSEIPMNVINYAAPDVPEYTPYSTMDIFKSPENWKVPEGSNASLKGDNLMEFLTPAGMAIYKNQKFENEIFKFHFNLEGTLTWAAITLRNQEITGSYTHNNYMIDFVPGGVELQRWNNGERTAIFCDLQNTRVGRFVPFDTTGGEIEVGTITEEDGVRIILKIDGETVINYLDKDENRITEPGYFGLMTERASFLIEGR